MYEKKCINVYHVYKVLTRAPKSVSAGEQAVSSGLRGTMMARAVFQSPTAAARPEVRLFSASDPPAMPSKISL